MEAGGREETIRASNTEIILPTILIDRPNCDRPPLFTSRDQHCAVIAAAAASLGTRHHCHSPLPGEPANRSCPVERVRVKASPLIVTCTAARSGQPPRLAAQAGTHPHVHLGGELPAA